jgi:hypothetical protein
MHLERELMVNHADFVFARVFLEHPPYCLKIKITARGTLKIGKHLNPDRGIQ